MSVEENILTSISTDSVIDKFALNSESLKNLLMH